MSLILVTGATGRHGGTGAFVARRLRQEGHQVRVLVRTVDERSEALEAEGFDVRFGDLRERITLLPAMEGVEQATFCFPIDGGIVEAAASFSSALRKVSPNARVVVMSMAAALEASPSALGRAAWLAEEVMAWSGLKHCVLRVAALFYENIMLLHRESILGEGAIRNCFGEARLPWIAGEDAGELMVTALLHPERFGEQQIIYPTGGQLLSHTEIADTLSNELSRKVRYEEISMEEWRDELVSSAEQGNPLINKAMAGHISAVGAMFSRRGPAQTAPALGDLAVQIGRAPISFQKFVQAHRDQLT